MKFLPKIRKINWRKLVSIILILILQFSSYPFAVFAQEVASESAQIATDSAELVTESADFSSDSATLDDLPILPEQITLDATSSAEVLSATTSAFIKDLETPEAAPSAQIKLPVKVYSLRKKHFRADEQVTIAVGNVNVKDLKVKLFNVKGEEVAIEVKEISSEDPVVLSLIPPAQFTPGRYRLKIEDSEGNITTQDFTWGVLAINTNKSIYLPSETAKLSLAVLDETGMMVCDAKVTLEITDPTNSKVILSTDSGEIIVNEECSIKAFVEKPDYETEYKVEETGSYEMILTAETENGAYSIADSFEVRESVSFDVERSSWTRIYPPEDYSMKIKITANEDFEGIVSEIVPESFEIIPLSGVEDIDGVRVVSQELASEEVLKASIFKIDLPFKGVYPLSLGFGAEHKDPTLSKKYLDFGVVGHDGLDFDVPSGTEILAVEEGEVVRARENYDYGTTIVIQHEWGKSYYGHLSELKVKEGDKVKKGDIIGLSGSTGLSSAPHLHFGIKLNTNDPSNGYYGKIDPFPYLGLETKEEETDDVKVLSAKDVTTNDVKILYWNLRLLKGETITLGYKFLAPQISPQFYLLGPAIFEEKSGEVVFRETRQWQIAADAVANNGIWAYGDSVDNGNMNFRAFTDPSTAGSELTTQATDTTNDISWIKTASSPTREETIAVTLKNTGRLDVLTCTTGCNAQADWTLRGTYSTAITDANAELIRPFDVAYEQLSGDAVVFFTDDNTTGTIYYCIWNGSSWSPSPACGSTFSPDTTNDIDLTAAGVTGQPEWIRAVAMGDRLTKDRKDEMLLAVSDSADDLWLAHWDGSAVDQVENPNPVDNLAATNAQKFDVAWEETTGEGLAVMTDTVDAAMRFITYDSAGGWGTVDTTNGPTNPATTAWDSWLELASDPSSDDIAMVGLLTTPDADAAVWTGAAWTNSTTAITDQETAVGKGAAVTFTRFSSRATFLNVGANDLDYDGHCWTSAGGFTALNTGVGTIALSDDGNSIVTVGSPNSNKMLGSSIDILDDLEGFIYTDATGCADGDWINSSVATAFNGAVRGVAGNLGRTPHWSAFTPYSPWANNWRWYDGLDGTGEPSTPTGTEALAAENTAPTDIDASSKRLRLRYNYAERGGMGETDTRKILQYTSGCNPNTAEGTCTWTDVADAAGATAFRYIDIACTPTDCADTTRVVGTTLTGTNGTCTDGNGCGTWVIDSNNAPGTSMDHNALIVQESEFVIETNGAAGGTTYYFRIYEPRISSNGQDSAVFREQDNDGANDCATATCTYPSLTIVAAAGPTTDQQMRHGNWFNSGTEQSFTF